METIMKIPFLLALFAAIVTGLLSINNDTDLNKTCVNMMIAMISFYLIGKLLSSTISGIIEEQNKQKQLAEEEKLRQERLESEQIEKQKAEKSAKEEHLGKKLDLVADNTLDDGFSPLDLSQAVRAKMKE
jgi:Na+-translocating ferredoxin:NAD+ oxidoreductase RnfG subunit